MRAGGFGNGVPGAGRTALRGVPFVVLPAVAGGFLGTRLNQRFDDAQVRRLYLAVMVALLR